MQGVRGLRIIAEIQIQDEELYQLKLKVLVCVCVAVWQCGMVAVCFGERKGLISFK
jgi:hypothetical protein